MSKQIKRYRATIRSAGSCRREWVYLCSDVPENFEQLFKAVAAQAVSKLVADPVPPAGYAPCSPELLESGVDCATAPRWSSPTGDGHSHWHPVAPAGGEPVGWGAFYLGGKNHGELRVHRETESEIDAYIQNTERSDDSISLQKGRIYRRTPEQMPLTALVLPQRKEFGRGKALDIEATGWNECLDKFMPTITRLQAEVDRLKDRLADANAIANLAATNLEEFKEDHRSELTKARERVYELENVAREFQEIAVGGFLDDDHVLRVRRDLEVTLKPKTGKNGMPNSTITLPLEYVERLIERLSKSQMFKETTELRAFLSNQSAPADDSYPPCDYCGTVPDYHPWHGSGMINGQESPHIHACNDCRGKLPAPADKGQGEPKPTGLSQGWNLTRKHDGFVIGHQSRSPDTKAIEQAERGGYVWVPFLVPDQPAPVAVVMPFADKVISKLIRVEACFSDGQSADIGRHWFDILTRLGLLNRVQRSPAMWEIAQQGEDILNQIKQ